MTERSQNMKDVETYLNETLSIISTVQQEIQQAQKCITNIGNLGCKLGYLYATCCTPTRETLYQGFMVGHADAF